MYYLIPYFILIILIITFLIFYYLNMFKTAGYWIIIISLIILNLITFLYKKQVYENKIKYPLWKIFGLWSTNTIFKVLTIYI